MKLKARKPDYISKISHCKKCNQKMSFGKGNTLCPNCQGSRRVKYGIGCVVLTLFVISVYVICLIG